MKKFIVSALPLVLSINLFSPTVALAESCYSVGGKVKMVNNLDDQYQLDGTQSGTIKIALTSSSGDEAFNSKGQLFGTITGQEYFVTTLSHTATLKDGSSFITKGDKAYITGVRAVTPEGVPCSFYVQEYITDITLGTGYFESVESVNILADGYISTCLPDENENKFVLSGSICVN